MKRTHGAYRKPKRTCRVTGKRPYPSQLAAENAAVTYHLRLGSRSRPYFCSYCGAWHLTTQPPQQNGTMDPCKKPESSS